MEDGSQAAGHYDALAAIYDARWRRYVEQSIGKTIAYLQPTDDEILLDVGCGTGQLLREAVRRWPALRAYGVDPSMQMLITGRRSGVPAVSVAQAVGERLPVPDCSIDWVVSTSVFHYLSEPRTALREWRRVLRPGGTLVITDWCRDYTTIRAYAAWERLTSPVRTTVASAAELRGWLSDTSFEEARIDRYRLNWFWGLMTATARRPVSGSQIGPRPIISG